MGIDWTEYWSDPERRTRLKSNRISQRLLRLAVVGLLSLGTLAAQAPAPATQPVISGDWKGALDAGGTQLHLVLHVVAATDGTLTALVDSVDQAAYSIPVTAITFKDGKLNLTIDAVHGTYEAKLSKDANELRGTWTQGQPLELNLTRSAAAPPPAPAAPSDIDGAWVGALDAGGTKLHIVIHFTNTANGLVATMDSPDQGVKGLPVTSVTRKDAALTLTIKQVGGGFTGTIAADHTNITGTWSQGGNSLPLVLAPLHDASSLEPKRPQDPVKPYPYREEEVSYINKLHGDTLAATLTIPQGKGPFPAVVLIAGSGPHDRDESLLGHRPFLVLSDTLTRQGIEVLRADKRGTAKSTGNYATATTADFATDVEAGVALLKTRPEVNAHKIGLVGHSEGGVIAPMVAARDHDVAYIVMLGGTGVPGDQIIVEQERLIAEASGVSKDKAAKDAATERKVLTLAKNGKDLAALETELRTETSSETTREATDAQVKAQTDELTSPWFRYFLTYDPAPALRQLKCPVLVLSGSKDLQVSPAQNLPAIRAALAASGNKHVEIDELSGLNHLFQTATTGSPNEYAQIEETMSPVALKKIASWILQQ